MASFAAQRIRTAAVRSASKPTVPITGVGRMGPLAVSL
jgi:hypothetical protein